MRKKIRLAVCFFGHMRTFTHTARSFQKKILAEYDCDLFFHTWSTLDHNTKTWHNSAKIEGFVSDKMIISAYNKSNVKGICIEDQTNLYDPTAGKTIKVIKSQVAESTIISLFGISCMMYSMKKSLQLCLHYQSRNNIEYDYILFIRPDLLIKQKIDINKIIAECPKRHGNDGVYTLYSSEGFVVSLGDEYSGIGGVDLCFFGKPEVLKKIITNNESIIDELSKLECIYMAPEAFFLKLIRKCGYTPYKINSNFIEIVRKRRLRMKSFFSCRIKKDYIKISFLSCLPINIFNISVGLLNNKYIITIILGKFVD